MPMNLDIGSIRILQSKRGSCDTNNLYRPLFIHQCFDPRTPGMDLWSHGKSWIQFTGLHSLLETTLQPPMWDKTKLTASVPYLSIYAKWIAVDVPLAQKRSPKSQNEARRAANGSNAPELRGNNPWTKLPDPFWKLSPRICAGSPNKTTAATVGFRQVGKSASNKEELPLLMPVARVSRMSPET